MTTALSQPNQKKTVLTLQQQGNTEDSEYVTNWSLVSYIIKILFQTL